MCKLFIGQRSSKVLEIMSNDRCEKPLWLSVFCLFPQFTPLHVCLGPDGGPFSVYQPLKLNDSSTTGPKLRDCWNFWNCRVSRIARALGCWVSRTLGAWAVGSSGTLGL